MVKIILYHKNIPLPSKYNIIHDIIPIDGLYKDRHPITLEKLDIE